MAQRNIRKAITDYKKNWTETADGAFYPSDILEIQRITKAERGNMVDAIYNALAVGFMVGYRKAKRDAKKDKTF